MKKIAFAIACGLLSIFIFTGQTKAQWFNSFGVTNIDQLTEAQCKLALEKATKLSRTGSTLTIIGGSAAVIGGVVYVSGLVNMMQGNIEGLGGNFSTAMIGAIALYCGVGIASVGIPIWIFGAIRKSDIEIALAKFPVKVTLLPKIVQGYGLGMGLSVVVTF